MGSRFRPWIGLGKLYALKGQTEQYGTGEGRKVQERKGTGNIDVSKCKMVFSRATSRGKPIEEFRKRAVSNI
jgi:hypothetical protein